MITVHMDLTKEVEEQARAAGLLDGEKLAALIETELQRQQDTAWARLTDTMHQLQAAAKADFEHLSDDEFMNMVNDIVHEVRAEIRKA